MSCLYACLCINFLVANCDGNFNTNHQSVMHAFTFTNCAESGPVFMNFFFPHLDDLDTVKVLSKLEACIEYVTSNIYVVEAIAITKRA